MHIRKILNFNKLLLITLGFLFMSFTTIISQADFFVSDTIDNDKNTIEEELLDITKNYGVNVDIIVISDNSNSCANARNFIDCTINKENLSADYFLGINNTSRDVESYRLDRVSYQDDIINERTLRGFQDNNLSLLSEGKQTDFILSFLSDIKLHFNELCKTYSDGIKCNIDTLNTNKREIEEKQNQIRKEKEKIEQEQLMIKKEESRKKQIIFLNKLLKIVFILGIILGIFYFLYVMYLYLKLKRLIKNLFLDIQEYKLFVDNNNLLLKDDKIELLRKINNLSITTEMLIGDRNKDFDRLDNLIKEKNVIENEIKQKEIQSNDIDELNNLMNDFNKTIL